MGFETSNTFPEEQVFFLFKLCELVLLIYSPVLQERGFGSWPYREAAKNESLPAPDMTLAGFPVMRFTKKYSVCHAARVQVLQGHGLGTTGTGLLTFEIATATEPKRNTGETDRKNPMSKQRAHFNQEHNWQIWAVHKLCVEESCGVKEVLPCSASACPFPHC